MIFSNSFSFFLFQKIQVPIYAAYLYDAVTVYARALDAVLKDGGSADNGTDIIERIRNTTFTSVYNSYFLIYARVHLRVPGHLAD